MDEGPPPRLLVLGLPPDARLGAVEELLSRKCAHRILQIDMRQGFAIATPEARSDVPSCVGRHELMGKVIVVLELSAEVDEEIRARGRIPESLAQQVAMLQSPEPIPGAARAAPPPSCAHPRVHSDSRLLQLGAKRSRSDMPMLPTAYEMAQAHLQASQGMDASAHLALHAQLQGSGGPALGPDKRGVAGPGGPAGVPGAAGMPQAAVPGLPPGFDMSLAPGLPHLLPAGAGGIPGLGPGGLALLPQHLAALHPALLASLNFNPGDPSAAGIPAGLTPQMAAQLRRQQFLHSIAGRKGRHARAHSDNAVLSAYDPARVGLACGIAEGSVDGLGADDALLRSAGGPQRRTRVGLSYKCGKCGQPKRGHVCKGSGKDGAKEGDEGAPAASWPASDGIKAEADEPPRKVPMSASTPSPAPAGGRAAPPQGSKSFPEARPEVLRPPAVPIQAKVPDIAPQGPAVKPLGHVAPMAAPRAPLGGQPVAGPVPIMPQSRSMPEPLAMAAVRGLSLGSEAAWAQQAAQIAFERLQNSTSAAHAFPPIREQGPPASMALPPADMFGARGLSSAPLAQPPASAAAAAPAGPMGGPDPALNDRLADQVQLEDVVNALEMCDMDFMLDDLAFQNPNPVTSRAPESQADTRA